MPEYPVGLATPDPDLLALGESTFSRRLIGGITSATGSGSLRLAYFTAAKTETTTQVRMISGSTAAGATPTLVRVGLYTVAANGDIALVASTPNDTTLLAAISTAYTKSWSASYAKVAGQRYAVGLLVVTAAAAPTMMGTSGQILAAESGQAPVLGGFVGAQADLPNSVVAAGIGGTGIFHYFAVLP